MGVKLADIQKLIESKDSEDRPASAYSMREWVAAINASRKLQGQTPLIFASGSAIVRSFIHEGKIEFVGKHAIQGVAGRTIVPMYSLAKEAHGDT